MTNTFNHLKCKTYAHKIDNSWMFMFQMWNITDKAPDIMESEVKVGVTENPVEKKRR